jgi:uncharacterized protein (DUF1501 family)
MTMDRRDFMMRGLAFGTVLALPRLSWAQGLPKEPGARTLVMLHLAGGNDGLNSVIPYKDPLYRILRPGIGIDAGQVRKVHESLGFHSALGGFEELWRKERLAVVNGVGYPRPNYSHFRATEIYYTAEPEQTPSYGWLGRALDAAPKQKPLRAIALGKEKPLSLAAASPGVVTLTDFAQFQLPEGSEEAVAMYETFKKMEGARAAVADRAIEALQVARRIASLRPVQQGFYGVLGRELAKVVALLRTDLDLEVIQLSFVGFDTHANQGPRHNGLLGQLGNNLRNYQNLLDRMGLGDRVVTCVFSEFGRRANENLSGGTDHGSAYPAFVLGQGIKPGLHGAYPSLEDLDNNNFKYTTDFRRLYAALVRDFLCMDPKPVLGEFEPLELIA